MKLFIDIGNSHIKLVNFDNHFGKVSTINYDKKSLADALSAEGLDSFPVPDEIVCINVAGDIVKNQIIEQCRGIWGLAPEFIDVCNKVAGVTNGYKDVGQLGVDRWMAMIAAWNIVQDNIMVVDIGSAMTIDLVNKEGLHLGGYIIPGDHLMAKSLLNNTDIKTKPDNKGFSMLPGKTTEECIANGTVRSLTSVIMDIYQSINENLEDNFQCVITGGGAININDYLSIPLNYQPMLVFEGMRIVKGYS